MVQSKVATSQRQHTQQIGVGGVIDKFSTMKAILHHLAYTVGAPLHQASQFQDNPPDDGILKVAPAR
jgi:hypothetical protein